jgi:DNA-binding MarR family transcriptional regulator
MSSPALRRARRRNPDGETTAKDVLFERPGYLIRRLNQIHYALFFEECGHENITPVQYGVLTAVLIRPGIDQTEIGSELGLDRTTTADVVRRLETKELVRREVDQRDRRARRVFITDKGAALTEELYEGMAGASQKMLSPLTPEKQELFVSLLAELVQANDELGRAKLSRV